MQRLEKRITKLEGAKVSDLAHLTDAELEERIEFYRAIVQAEAEKTNTEGISNANA